jgi:hypothetical protein
MAGHSYTLLSRPECHLCEEFLDALREFAPEVAAATAIENVDSREDWQHRFGPRIPVLIDRNGAVISEGLFDPGKLAERP